MLIIALVLAVVGLAALVTAVVTSNELIAWVCIAASVLGVILLIIDAIRERQQRDAVPATAGGGAVAETAEGDSTAESTYQNFDADYPDDLPAEGAPAVAAETEADGAEHATEPEPAEPEAADVAATHAEQPDDTGASDTESGAATEAHDAGEEESETEHEHEGEAAADGAVEEGTAGTGS
ncbi:MAG TPA: hypothetical protein VFW21_12595 [Mycobacterium sp.]|nr:hypothetical protein [Mycobacterium sp.]